MRGIRSEVPRLAALVTLIANYHPRGLRVLLGESPEPTTEERAELIEGLQGRPELGVSVDGGSQGGEALNAYCRVEPLLEIVDLAGGWPEIQESVRQVRALQPLAWNRFAEFVMWVGSGSRLNECGGHLERIAAKYRVSVPTVYRWRNEVPNLIARHSLAGGQNVLFFSDGIPLPAF